MCPSNHFALFSYERSDNFVGEIAIEGTILDDLKLEKDTENSESDKTSEQSTTAFHNRSDQDVKTESENGPTLNGACKTNNSTNSEVGSVPERSNDECANLVHSSYGTIKKTVLYSPVGFLFQWTTTCPAGNPPFYSLLIAMLTATMALIMLIFGTANYAKWWFIFLLVIFILSSLCCLCFISLFIQDDSIRTFKVNVSLFC